MVFADHRHRPRISRTVAAAAFAVVVGGVGIEANAGIVRIAFAGFFFGGSLFGFFGGASFGFFGRTPFGFRGSHPSPVATGHDLPMMAACGDPRLLPHLRTVNRSPVELRPLEVSLLTLATA